MNQPYNGFPPFTRDCQTSQDAAYSVRNWRLLRVRTAALRNIVLEFISSRGVVGATDDEIYEAFPQIGEATLRPRRVELTHMGKVSKTDRVRPTRRGRDAIVWVVTDHAAVAA